MLGNSRIHFRNFRILCDEIPQSSWGMTQGLNGILNGILNEIASDFSKPRNDEFWGILEFTREF